MRNSLTEKEIKNTIEAVDIIRETIRNHLFELDPKTTDNWNKVETELDKICYIQTGFHMREYPISE